MARPRKRGEYVLRAISPDDNVSGLFIADAKCKPLVKFLNKDAIRFHSNNAAKTYVITTQKSSLDIVAYITLLCSHISLDTPPDGLSGYDPIDFEDYPAVKIARLAVDDQHSGQGLGVQLVDLAMAIASERVMPHVGCRFLVLDSKKDKYVLSETPQPGEGYAMRYS